MLKINASNPILNKNNRLTSNSTHFKYLYLYTSKEEMYASIYNRFSISRALELWGYVDASLSTDKVTGRSCTSIMIFFGNTLLFYKTKYQVTVETSTFSSKCVAIRTTCKEIIGIQAILQLLGILIKNPSYLMVDNKGVLLSTKNSASLLKKLHVALRYHKTREIIVSGAVVLDYIKANLNQSDIMTKSVDSVKFTATVM